MSGGQHEARALGESVTQVQNAAVKLADALKEVADSLRGISVSDVEIQDVVNAVLHESGWKIQRPRRGSR